MTRACLRQHCRLSLDPALKGGRLNTPLPMQNDGQGFLHGIHFVRLAFHFDNHVFFVARAA